LSAVGCGSGTIKGIFDEHTVRTLLRQGSVSAEYVTILSTIAEQFDACVGILDQAKAREIQGIARTIYDGIPLAIVATQSTPPDADIALIFAAWTTGYVTIGRAVEVLGG
jgi:hypothetical protein